MDFNDLDPLDKKRLRVGLSAALWVAQAVYIVFPFDLLPDFIPFIGWLDDLVALLGLAATTIWVLRQVHDVGLNQLFGTESTAIPAEPYDPIPPEVISSL
jgi:hypothetical protein